MELFFFRRDVFDALPVSERSKYLDLMKSNAVPTGRPFFLGSDGLPDRELDGFCAYLLDPRRGSAKTWLTYANQVAVFLRFIQAQGKSWKDVTPDDLKVYYRVRTTGEFQEGTVLKGRSWNVAKSAIVHFYEYAQEAGLIEALPFKYRRTKSIFGSHADLTADLGAKVRPEPLNFISIRQYKELWRPALAQKRNAQRNLALSDLLVTVGLRISEALSLQTHQIPDPDNAAYAGKKSVSIRVVGKGRKARLVRVPKRILRAIRFYIDEERNEHARKNPGRGSPAFVFLTHAGTPLTARSVQAQFKAISQEVGIRLTPHGCRHTFAVYQLDSMVKRMAKNLKQLKLSGADAYRQIMNDPLRQIQLLLGHAHIETTFIYLDFLEESEALVDESLADWADWEAARE